MTSGNRQITCPPLCHPPIRLLWQEDEHLARMLIHRLLILPLLWGEMGAIVLFVKQVFSREHRINWDFVKSYPKHVFCRTNESVPGLCLCLSIYLSSCVSCTSPIVPCICLSAFVAVAVVSVLCGSLSRSSSCLRINYTLVAHHFQEIIIYLAMLCLLLPSANDTLFKPEHSD